MLFGIVKQNFRRLTKAEWLVFAFLIAAAVLSFAAVSVLAGETGSLEIYFLDVGQGDAVFIQTPGGNQVLIDGGPDSKIIQELGKIMPFYDRSVDLIILTHPDADHLNGLIDVLKRYDVEQILENPVYYDGSNYKIWDELESEAEVINARSGQVVEIGDGAKLFILYPVNTGGKGSSKMNNNSIVGKLVFGDNSLLLSGDIEATVEREIINRGMNVDSDFLKVAHHGSKTSTSEEFLKAVSPELAFISVGLKNSYGHPSQEILKRLDKLGLKYYRTDVRGTIKLVLNQQGFQLFTER